jgi:hypothetical protein
MHDWSLLVNIQSQSLSVRYGRFLSHSKEAPTFHLWGLEPYRYKEIIAASLVFHEDIVFYEDLDFHKNRSCSSPHGIF